MIVLIFDLINKSTIFHKYVIKPYKLHAPKH